MPENGHGKGDKPELVQNLEELHLPVTPNVLRDGGKEYWDAAYRHYAEIIDKPKTVSTIQLESQNTLGKLVHALAGAKTSNDEASEDVVSRLLVTSSNIRKLFALRAPEEKLLNDFNDGLQNFRYFLGAQSEEQVNPAVRAVILEHYLDYFDRVYNVMKEAGVFKRYRDIASKTTAELTAMRIGAKEKLQINKMGIIPDDESERFVGEVLKHRKGKLDAVTAVQTLADEVGSCIAIPVNQRTIEMPSVKDLKELGERTKTDIDVSLPIDEFRPMMNGAISLPTPVGWSVVGISFFGGDATERRIEQNDLGMTFIYGLKRVEKINYRLQKRPLGKADPQPYWKDHWPVKHLRSGEGIFEELLRRAKKTPEKICIIKDRIRFLEPIYTKNQQIQAITHDSQNFYESQKALGVMGVCQDMAIFACNEIRRAGIPAIIIDSVAIAKDPNGKMALEIKNQSHRTVLYVDDEGKFRLFEATALRNMDDEINRSQVAMDYPHIRECLSSSDSSAFTTLLAKRSPRWRKRKEKKPKEVHQKTPYLDAGKVKKTIDEWGSLLETGNIDEIISALHIFEFASKHGLGGLSVKELLTGSIENESYIPLVHLLHDVNINRRIEDFQKYLQAHANPEADMRLEELAFGHGSELLISRKVRSAICMHLTTCRVSYRTSQELVEMHIKLKSIPMQKTPEPIEKKETMRGKLEAMVPLWDHLRERVKLEPELKELLEQEFEWFLGILILAYGNPFMKEILLDSDHEETFPLVMKIVRMFFGEQRARFVFYNMMLGGYDPLSMMMFCSQAPEFSEYFCDRGEAGYLQETVPIPPERRIPKFPKSNIVDGYGINRNCVNLLDDMKILKEPFVNDFCGQMHTAIMQLIKIPDSHLPKLQLLYGNVFHCRAWSIPPHRIISPSDAEKLLRRYRNSDIDIEASMVWLQKPEDAPATYFQMIYEIRDQQTQQYVLNQCCKYFGIPSVIAPERKREIESANWSKVKDQLTRNPDALSINELPFTHYQHLCSHNSSLQRFHRFTHFEPIPESPKQNPCLALYHSFDDAEAFMESLLLSDDQKGKGYIIGLIARELDTSVKQNMLNMLSMLEADICRKIIDTHKPSIIAFFEQRADEPWTDEQQRQLQQLLFTCFDGTPFQEDFHQELNKVPLEKLPIFVALWIEGWLDKKKKDFFGNADIIHCSCNEELRKLVLEKYKGLLPKFISNPSHSFWKSAIETGVLIAAGNKNYGEVHECMSERGTVFDVAKKISEEPILHIPLRTRNLNGSVGSQSGEWSSKETKTKTRGSGDFQGHREYQPGDDLKLVDWKAWGKTDKFYTKDLRESSQPRETQYVVDLEWLLAYFNPECCKNIQLLVRKMRYDFVSSKGKIRQSFRLIYRGEECLSLNHNELQRCLGMQTMIDALGERTECCDFILTLNFLASRAHHISERGAGKYEGPITYKMWKTDSKSASKILLFTKNEQMIQASGSVLAFLKKHNDVQQVLD